jgi:hypothetical protein
VDAAGAVESCFDVTTQTEFDNHLNDTTDAHDASAISVDSTNLDGTSVTVQGSLEEIETQLDNHVTDSAGAHAATAITFTPNGSIEATTVQAAIQEVRDEAGGVDTDDQNATEVPYTPTTGTDWTDPDPAEVGAALDAAAGRITVVEGKALHANFTDDDHTQYSLLFTFTGAVQAGSCTTNREFWHATDTGKVYNCPAGAGDTPEEVFADAPAYTTIQGNSGSATAADGANTLNIVGANNIDCVAADGSPDSVTCQLSIASQAQGDIIYHNGTTWVRLAAGGTAGHFLKTNGAGANPEWAAAGGAVSTLHIFRPQQNEPPAANFATLDTRNGHPVLDFDSSTQEAAVFSGVLNRGYSGGNLVVDIWFSCDTNTTADEEVVWEAAFEKLNTQDLDSDSFATAIEASPATCSTTAGVMTMATITFTSAQIDGLTAGDPFRIKVLRDPANAGDDLDTIDAELRIVEIRQ